MSNYLMQSTFGKQGNFEVVAPLATGGLAHFFRDNEKPDKPWSAPNKFGPESVKFCGTALIQSNYNKPGGNFEVVAVSSEGQLFHFWRNPDFTWSQTPTPIASGVTGTPSLIQSTFGEQGNFEVVVPLATGGLAHFFRDNEKPDKPWSGSNPFGPSDLMFSAVSLIQSNYNKPGGNFEVVAINGNRLFHFWRNPDFTWSQNPTPITTEAIGIPSLIQSTFGEQGNFEVVVPLATGGLAHFFRDNEKPDKPWIPAGRIDVNNGQFNGAALIQSNYNNPGNFEVVAVTREGQLHHYWRNPDFTWSRTLTPIASGVNIAIPHVNIHVYMAPGANRISNTPGVTDRVQEQIDVANAIWSREAGIRVNLIGITKIVTMPPAESIAFKSKDIPCGIAEFVDNFPNPIRGRVSRLLGFRDLTRSTLPVYFIGGDDIQPNPQVTGCILITRHPDVGIVLSNGALNRILAHEIGHALFFDPTNLTGARPVLPDPSADPTGDPNHSTVANNLMRDTVPSNFTIILVESQMNRALRSNFVIRC